MAKKSSADKKREESKKNLDARREAGTLRSADVNDPLLGWDAQQGAPGAAAKSRLYADDPVVYSKDQLPRNRPEIVPEDQRGDLDAEVTADDGGPQTANVAGEDEEAGKNEGDDDKKVVKKSSSKK